MSETKTRDQVAEHNEAVAAFRRLLHYQLKADRVPEPTPYAMAIRREAALLMILEGMELYAKCYAADYGDAIGEDGLLGQAYSDIFWELRNFLTCDMGRLDGGEMTKMIRTFQINHKIPIQE